MKLTRRDALIATATAGALGMAGVGASNLDGRSSGRSTLTIDDVETMEAVAEIVYPSEIETSVEFVEEYTAELHVSRRRGITAAIDDLDRATRRNHGSRFAAFDHDQRTALFRDLGVHRVQPNSTGTVPERIRSYLVNGLLFALFTTPTGGALVSIENPLGYPGEYEVGLRESPS